METARERPAWRDEANLVELARHSTAAQLEKMCNLFRRIQPHDPAKPPERYLHRRDTDDGMVRIEIQLASDEAARLLKACDAAADTRVDGLLVMAEATLRGDHPDRPPVEVLVHVDAATLGGEEEQTGISAETARRLLCDAGIVPILNGADGAPLDAGRKRRTLPAALRRVLVARDRGCRFPGCTNRRFVDGHHLKHWADGGKTRLANTILLCSRHHTLVHEGGFRAVVHGDRLRFFDPAGAELPNTGPPVPVGSLPSVAYTPSPGWDGDPVDYDAAVACLT